METDATNLTPAIALDGLAGCVSLAEAPSAPCPEITLGCGGLRLEDVHSVARKLFKSDSQC